jgi:hypothetical protein
MDAEIHSDADIGREIERRSVSEEGVAEDDVTHLHSDLYTASLQHWRHLRLKLTRKFPDVTPDPLSDKCV